MGDMVNVYEAKAQFSRLLVRVESGEEITLARNGTPIALLTPMPSSRAARVPGALKGQIVISPDFDEFTDDDDRDWHGA